jgi:hypothetical protein
MRKAEAPITAPTGKWGIARRHPLSHRNDSPFDTEGQGAVARHIMQKFYILSYLLRKAEAPFFYMDFYGSLWTKLMVME